MKVSEIVNEGKREHFGGCGKYSSGKCNCNSGVFNAALSLEVSEEKLRALGYIKIPRDYDMSKFLTECSHLGTCIYDQDCHEHWDMVRAIITFLGGGK